MEKKKIVLQIVKHLGGVTNIISATNCMTRLRVTVCDDEPVNIEKIKATESVLEVINDRAAYYEIVVGPGNSRVYADICHDIGIPATAAFSADKGCESKNGEKDIKNGHSKANVRDKLKIIGEIFVPLIPGVITAGLCAGFASLLTQIVPGYKEIAVWNVIYQLLSMGNIAFMTYITGWAGYRAAERFGATPILGGMLGLITSLSGIDEIALTLGLYNAESPLQSVLKSGKGGVLAVICGVFFLSRIEKFIRRRMPASLDTVVTPMIAFILCSVPYILVVMPAFGYVSTGIVWLFGNVCMSESVIVRMAVGYVASALFLPMVATGMHHGMVALYSVQLQELGYVTLYPALCMAGAGQVGASIALYRKAMGLGHKKLCSVIRGSLPAGLLGIGEPLIYGVTLPLGQPFITAGLGAGFGGAFVMAFRVASTTWGPSGLTGIFVMTAGKGGTVFSMAMYVVGLLISYAMSYIITMLFIKNERVAEALGGIPLEGIGRGSAATKKTPAADTSFTGAEEAFFEDAGTHRRVEHGEAVEFGDGISVQLEHVIQDPIGIHARPAGEFVNIVNDTGCDVSVECNGKIASGKSVVELMMLNASGGSRIVVTVKGSNAGSACNMIKKFMNARL